MTSLVTLAGVLVIVLVGLILGLIVLLWTRYRIDIQAAHQVDELIEANRATARPGMTKPDDRFRQAAEARAQRRRGPYAG